MKKHQQNAYKSVNIMPAGTEFIKPQIIASTPIRLTVRARTTSTNQTPFAGLSKLFLQSRQVYLPMSISIFSFIYFIGSSCGGFVK